MTEPIPFDQTVTDSMLDHECERIYRAMFDTPPPDVIRKRFLAPSRTLNQRYVTRAVEHHYHAIEHIGDLEALEVASRYTQSMPLLCAKFRLVVYLAETLPENQHHFINTRDSIVAGLWAVLAGAIRTGVKLIWGLLLRQRLPDA